jgi:predicted nucleic acid-binding protein
MLPTTIALDTNCFIYLFDTPGSERAAFLEREIFRPAAMRQRKLVTTSLTVAELLVAPFRANDDARAVALREALETFPGLRIVDVDVRIATLAARLRGSRGVTLPDAIQLAAASLEADALLTNDARLANVAPSTSVLLLDEVRRT